MQHHAALCTEPEKLSGLKEQLAAIQEEGRRAEVELGELLGERDRYQRGRF